jgi:putative transposon-encoded protein
MKEYKEDVLQILQNDDFEDIIVKQITNGGSSGRVFVPKKYVGMDAIILIRDSGVCSHCNGTTQCNCPDCVYNSSARLIRRKTLIPVTCQQCKGTGKK